MPPGGKVLSPTGPSGGGGGERGWRERERVAVSYNQQSSLYCMSDALFSFKISDVDIWVIFMIQMVTGDTRNILTCDLEKQEAECRYWI